LPPQPPVEPPVEPPVDAPVVTTSPVVAPNIITDPTGTVISGPLVEGTNYPTNWQSDTGGGGTVTTYDVNPDTGARTQTATGATTYGPGSDLLLTPEDIAAQNANATNADYNDALNVNNIENANYIDTVNNQTSANNQSQSGYNDALNVYQINADNAATERQDILDTVAADNVTRQANYQGALTDYYAANPNAVQYTDDYGRGITSTIPDVAPNVFPVTGGSDYGTGVVGFDYNPDPYVGVHYDNAADRYAQEMTQANDFGGGGGGCPAPWVPILLADQTTREAGSLEPGMQVWTQHEQTGEWGAFPITAVSLDYANRWKIELTNGDDFVGTSNHRVLTDKGWKEIQNLKSGAKLVQPEGFGVVLSSAPAESGTVVKITVHDAHTYVSSGFVSHNIKNSGGGDFGGSGINMNEFARGGIASLPKSPGQRLLAAHRAGDMATVHRMLKKVRR